MPKKHLIILLGSKITADGDCSHEIKRCLLLGRKPMTNLDSILKSRDCTGPGSARSCWGAAVAPGFGRRHDQRAGHLRGEYDPHRQGRVSPLAGRLFGERGGGPEGALGNSGAGRRHSSDAAEPHHGPLPDFPRVRVPAPRAAQAASPAPFPDPALWTGAAHRGVLCL